MKSIKLTRKKLNAEEQKRLEQTLQDCLKDKDEGIQIFLEEDDEVLDAVLIPAGSRFAPLLEDLNARKHPVLEFKWGDPELSAQLGLCLMQLVLRGGRHMILLGNGSQISFGMVTLDFYERYENM